MMGGTIVAESTPNVGSKFTVTLPLKLPNIKGKENQRENLYHSVRSSNQSLDNLLEEACEASVAGPTTKVLIIDDDSNVHEIIKHSLKKYDFNVHSAFSGKEGLAFLDSADIDLIVLDIFMPDIDGWHVLQEIKSNRRTAHIPVILYTIDSDKTRGFSLGASDFLIKPISNNRLLEVIKKHSLHKSDIRILSIDDDEGSQKLIRAYLKETNWTLVTAFSANDALKLLAKDESFSVILLDLIMPNMNGFEFIEHINFQNKYCNIPIIVISAKDLSVEERDLLMSHSSCIMKKGMYDKSTLINRINAALADTSLEQTNKQ